MKLEVAWLIMHFNTSKMLNRVLNTTLIDLIQFVAHLTLVIINRSLSIDTMNFTHYDGSVIVELKTKHVFSFPVGKKIKD